MLLNLIYVLSMLANSHGDQFRTRMVDIHLPDEVQSRSSLLTYFMFTLILQLYYLYNAITITTYCVIYCFVIHALPQSNVSFD